MYRSPTHNLSEYLSGSCDTFFRFELGGLHPSFERYGTQNITECFTAPRPETSPELTRLKAALKRQNLFLSAENPTNKVTPVLDLSSDPLIFKTSHKRVPQQRGLFSMFL